MSSRPGRRYEHWMTRRGFLTAAGGFLLAAAGCRAVPAHGEGETAVGREDSGIARDRFRPGAVWLDTDGAPIQAHGGGMLFHEGIYYWFGENKSSDTKRADLARVDVVGVSCYSSADLLHWKNEGIVLPARKDDPDHDLHPSRVVERPKVLYNEATRTFVMWMHIDTADYGYARTGVATSDSPTGPYRYLGSLQPNGADSRDMTVYKDDDGAAYLFHSSQWNRTMHIVRLSDDYLGPTDRFVRVFANRSREAPAVFKDGGRYYCITSGCTGWDPNPAEYAVSDTPMGPWTVRGNPCIGTPEQVRTTFHAQSTFVLPVHGRPTAYIFMADRWKRTDLGDSRYVWLPLAVRGPSLAIRWYDEWDLGHFGA